MQRGYRIGIFAKGEVVRLYGGLLPQPVGGISWFDSCGDPNSSNEAFLPAFGYGWVHRCTIEDVGVIAAW
jgi:hypothetical protein